MQCKSIFPICGVQAAWLAVCEMRPLQKEMV